MKLHCWFVSCCLVAVAGCHNVAATDRAMLEAILPHKIEIVAPLTQPTSLDQDAIPEGLAVVVRATDEQGDPAKLAGHMVFELYTYRPASADPKGDLIQTWTRDIAGLEDQASFWNRVTRMYEFPLSLDVSEVPRRPRYVVRVRYTNPWEQHIEDQATLDFREYVGRVRRELRRGSGA